MNCCFGSALTSTKKWEAKIKKTTLLQSKLKYDFQLITPNHSDILKNRKTDSIATATSILFET